MHLQLNSNARLWLVFAGLCLLFLAAPAQAAKLSFPELTGRVVDEANLLPAAQQEQLTQTLADFEQATSIQLVVVTLKSTPPVAIEDFGYQLGRHWGIGEKGKNNGILLIVDPTSHQLRIEVGYGLEGALTDAQSKMIIEQVIVPRFKQGDYASGIVAGASAIMQTVKGEGTPKPAGATTANQDGGISFATFLIFLFLFMFLRGFGRSRRSGWVTPLLLGSMLSSSNRYDGGGWGGGGGGGFSGGGGSFGGGGASGRW